MPQMEQESKALLLSSSFSSSMNPSLYKIHKVKMYMLITYDVANHTILTASWQLILSSIWYTTLLGLATLEYKRAVVLYPSV